MKNSAISLTPARAALMTVLASSVLLSGCYSTSGHVPDKTRFPEGVPSGSLDFVKPDRMDLTKGGDLPVAQRLAIADGGTDKLYSFKAMGQSLRVTMDQFAKANRLNLIFDQDVAGVVNVEFHDLTLEQALDAILDPIGVGWVQEDGVIRITRQVMKTYQVDYLRSSRVKITVTNSGTGSGSGSGSGATVESVEFWGEMEKELKSLLAKETTSGSLQETSSTTTNPDGRSVTTTARPIQQVEGRVTINTLTGTVQVVTSPRRMRAVDAYMQNMLKGMNRQVYIEARILNVRLQDDAAYGIDWSRISFGPSLSVSNSNIITSATGGASVKPSTGFLSYDKTFPSTFLVNNVTAAIQALEEQGTVRVVSQPRIRTLNNQPAIIKVGTDRTFYTQTTTDSCTNIGSTTVCIPKTQDNPFIVNDGVTLTVTPQISSTGFITLDVVPRINKIVGIDTALSGKSSAPQVETMETSTLVRMKDGETAVVGGLIIEEDSETGRALPGLGDAGGGLGWLAKGKYSNKVRKELVIFITPHLIDN